MVQQKSIHRMVSMYPCHCEAGKNHIFWETLGLKCMEVCTQKTFAAINVCANLHKVTIRCISLSHIFCRDTLAYPFIYFFLFSVHLILERLDEQGTLQLIQRKFIFCINFVD